MSARSMALRLVAVAIVPIALSGCDLPEAAGGKQPTAAAPAAMEPAAADSWIIVEKGARQEEEQDERPATAAPVEEETLAAPHLPEPAPAGSAIQRCVSMFMRGRIAPLHVDAGSDTVTVSWYHPGDPSVLTYRITSINQNLVVGEQKPLTWHETKPKSGCGTLSATIRGLQPGTPYVFSVDVLRRATSANTSRSATVARSAVVYTH